MEGRLTLRSRPNVPRPQSSTGWDLLAKLSSVKLSTSRARNRPILPSGLPLRNWHRCSRARCNCTGPPRSCSTFANALFPEQINIEWRTRGNTNYLRNRIQIFVNELYWYCADYWRLQLQLTEYRSTRLARVDEILRSSIHIELSFANKLSLNVNDENIEISNFNDYSSYTCKYWKLNSFSIWMDKFFEKTFIGQSDELSIEVNYIITYGLLFLHFANFSLLLFANSKLHSCEFTIKCTNKLEDINYKHLLFTIISF